MIQINTEVKERLEKLPKVLSDPQLLSGKGIGNEIGFYIFDYDPEDEPTVQRYLQKELQKKLDFPVLEIHLYQLVMEYLQNNELLEACFELEQTEGTHALEDALKDALQIDGLAELLFSRVESHHQMVFITGVGAAWPMLRSHTVLNNLHDKLDQLPVIMFFPGTYTGQELQLFSTFKDDNYYRAFRLLPRS
ncbi:DUF1788 domain-containing protein [Deinococcus cellulosilyticus]|uniref:Cytoplasmic protein n=1 Tax=Deinococcus cellulosilyticus (strain DSM 18568 / NBRC 106333 / KACC 11606 / 5516J-15) TaxID=1223518 RepID=A0A511N9E0_DEIC1|nr:DUF1788 domain-containing protein [Deinococcus cellulosilyticus]GEM49167.1 hypothetical protein DC3_48020 [Deinococcus cellulosilyticus NBRC 106333 = KACC 11606]